MERPASAEIAETAEAKQARQRASVKWILSKAFNNRVPDNLRDPFYRDHDGQEHLKPQIVVGLGNATLYCQTLSNLYSDPNYQSLNHWSILQTLNRKGVPVGESADVPLTETVLIQTNPLRINAHMAVIEALMFLYAKEVASGDRVAGAVTRISGGVLARDATQNHESAMLCWVSHACAALKKRINQEIELGATDENGVRLQSPDIPIVHDYRDLCDGVCLAYLLSYYCPKVVPWTSVRVNYLPTVEDSIHNVLLVSNFSQKYLPYTVFHMTPEDITYMRGSMKQNLVVLLADLFNLFEIHPAKCVCFPGMDQQTAVAERSGGANEHGIVHRRGLTCQPVTPIPDLRSGLDTPTNSPSNRPPFQVTRSPSQTTMRRHTPPKDIQQDMPAHVQQPAPVQQQMQPQQQQQSGDDGFVVHRSRGVTTLSSMQEPLVPARLRQAKEKSNNDTKADERGDNHAAGRPSNWEDTRRPTYAGRRSRRNSTSDDSQLTIENFGGSQDQLHTIGRTVERERKISSTSVIVSEPAVAIRSTLADARGSIQIGYETDSGSEKQDRETEKTALRRQGSMDNVSLRNIIHSKEKDTTDGDATMAAAASPRNIAQAVSQQLQQQIQQMQLDSEEQPKRKTSFATLPNTTTWQQQSANSQQLDNSDSENRPIVDATKLSTIRLKLEEKRRHIEQEKKKMEFAMSRQQQKGKVQTQSDVGDSKEAKDSLGDPVVDKVVEKPCSLQDLPDLNNLETKWDAQSVETKRTPDLDQMDMETYQQSIAAMNCSLQDIQQDIHRLASQQTHIQAHHLQAQQLMQAQQIANMLNQYGSQQNLPGQFARQVSQTSQPQPPPTNYGSTPQLSQLFNTTNTAQSPHTNNYSTLGRPPSRDPYLMQQPPQHTPPPQPQIFQQTLTPSSQHQQMQYLNEQGQYIPQPYAPSGYMTQRDNNQYVMGENGQSQSPYQQQQQYMSQQFTNQYIEQNHHQQPQYQSNQYLGRGAPPVDEIIYPDTYHRNVRDQHSPNQFYLHDTQQPQAPPTPPQPAQRRTWAQSASQHQQDMNTWSQSGSPKIDTRTWKSPNQNSGGFVLHQQNGNDYDNQEQSYQNLFPVHASPQHSRVQRQISQIIANDSCERPVRNKPMSPPADDMAPQSISFIGDEDSVDPLIQNTTKRDTQNYMQHLQQQDMEIHLGKLNITSGNRTYRIPSPTRPLLNPKSFQNPQHDEDAGNEKGFYISFDDQPKRPKPPLRAKRSPKKERSIDSMEKQDESSQEYDRDMDKDRYNNQDQRRVPAQENRTSMHEPMMNKMHMNDNQMPLDRRHLEDLTNHHQQNNQSSSTINDNRPREGKALIIGTELSNLDPSEVDEMEKKKERIMLLSLQRRQQQEEAKVRKEIQSMQQRDKEREKEEERIRKREEQVARRQAILEQYKLKKAIEEAEREGKTLDKADQLLLNRQQQQHGHHSAQPQAKMRAQKSMRPRPKTIHVETGSVDLSEASSLASRGKKGSSSNLTGVGSLSSHSMRRDYYRGSQDSLAIRESPDEYPSTSSTPIGRRGSYKTTREPTVERGRTISRISVAKGSNLNNFRGRKSNSLMNLCDTDSGLGRATPPRRAPSPGMGPSGRHLPSPSGPGSLPPGLMTKRRMFDDGSSDISSTPSSMMEYSGPKLYKQPATKSNRGIILNAVEYCVFPGVVNRDAKQKVLEKIARSEAKHFLVLFRDAGCQFRALYGYWPETETIVKLYGTGPSQVDELMFDKFFKYNSGGKCFSQVHTKHLTVTIDAFTIHNSLWQGKKVNYISKKDVPLVI